MGLSYARGIDMKIFENCGKTNVPGTGIKLTARHQRHRSAQSLYKPRENWLQ